MVAGLKLIAGLYNQNHIPSNIGKLQESIQGRLTVFRSEIEVQGDDSQSLPLLQIRHKTERSPAGC